MLENRVIQKAIRDNDAEIFTGLPGPTLFGDIINQHLWKLALKNYTDQLPTGFQDIHKAINASEVKQKEPLHSRLNDIEQGAYWFTNGDIDEVKEQWQTRVFKHLGKDLIKTGTDDMSLDEARENIIKYYNLIKDIRDEKKVFISLEDVQTDILDRKAEDLSDYRLNVPANNELKAIFGDYMLPRFYIMAGLPSMGKNIIIDRLVTEFIKAGQKGVYFSFDNSAIETGYMIKHIMTGISYETIETGLLSDWERKEVENSRIVDKRLFITSKRLNIDKIRVHLEKLKNSDEWGDLRYFVIDYFQNIPFRPNARGKEIQEYEHMSREINKVCSDLGITAIILSQSNDRSRDDYVKFTLNDLKWAGSLGQDAFYVAGIEGERDSIKRTIKIAKNKRGALGSFDIEYVYGKKQILKWMPRG